MLVPSCLIKFVELMLAVACLVLHQYSYDLTDLPTLMLCSGTYVGYIVVISGEIVGEMIFSPLDLVQDMYFGILGVGLFSICGGLVLSARSKVMLYPRTGDYHAALLVGCLAILNSLVMLFDIILAYLDSEEFEDDASDAVSATPDSYVSAWWSALGAALYGGCGAQTMSSWRGIAQCPRRINAHASAICALVTACVLLMDTIMSLCYPRTEERETDTKE